MKNGLLRSKKIILFAILSKKKFCCVPFLPFFLNFAPHSSNVKPLSTLTLLMMSNKVNESNMYIKYSKIKKKKTFI